jgi:hypothetical protein
VALPNSPNTNYTPADDVKSNDLNDIQACIVGMKVPEHWRWEHPGRGYLETNISFDVGGGIGSGDLIATAPAALFAGKLSAVPVGYRVSAMKARFLGTGGVATAHVYLQRNNGDGSFSNLGDLAIVNPAAAWAEYTLDPIGIVAAMASPAALYLAVTMPLAGMRMSNLGIRLDKL